MIFGGREGFRWIGMVGAIILGLFFVRIDRKSVPNRVVCAAGAFFLAKVSIPGFYEHVKVEKFMKIMIFV